MGGRPVSVRGVAGGGVLLWGCFSAGLPLVLVLVTAIDELRSFQKASDEKQRTKHTQGVSESGRLQPELVKLDSAGTHFLGCTCRYETHSLCRCHRAQFFTTKAKKKKKGMEENVPNCN